jgi:hypothetical protein
MSVFSAAGIYPDSIRYATLIQALEFNGGDGVDGGARILLRNAVASVLNAAHPQINYPLLETDVIGDVNGALASHNRDTMLALEGVLDGYNNLGSPLWED